MSRKTAIFKYRLELETGVQTLRIPGQNPVVRHVAVQDTHITMWLEVDPEAQPLESDFKIVATGEPWTASAWRHRGTVLMAQGYYVWHVLQAVKL
jgi:hypothetical protein